MQETQVNSFLNKVRRTRVRGAESQLADLTGLDLPGGYHVNSRLPVASGEADIYTASKDSKEFILKYYRRENAVKEEVIRLLESIHCPEVAPVTASGIFQGHQYVIMPCYKNMSLAEMLENGATLTMKELKELVIPSVNAGLRAVHEAGILHKDLKPANLIPDDSGEHIVLIDFGISSAANGRTLVVTATGMTPIYAAPEVLQGIYHASSDYYSFGITIYELYTGHPPFQQDCLNSDDAIRLAAVSKIEFPEDFPAELRDLVLGLTYKDISNRNSGNARSRRWGWQEVENWLKGIKQPVPGMFPDEAPAFLPYVFDKTRYTDEESLIRAFLAQPDKGMRELGRGILSHHYSLFREKSRELCEEYAKKLSLGRGAARMGAFLSLMYRLWPGIDGLYLRGEFFKELGTLGSRMVDAVTSEDSSFLKAAFELLESGFLTEYARDYLKSPAALQIFTRLTDLLKTREFTMEQRVYACGAALSDNHSFMAAGKKYASPEEFSREMDAYAAKHPEAYARQMIDCYDHLNFLVCVLPGQAEKELLKKHLKNDYLIFGSDDYIFRDREHMVSRMDEIAAGKCPWEILYLEGSYHRGITEISSGLWLDGSIPARLTAAKEAAREKLNAILTGDDAGIRNLVSTVKKLPQRSRTRAVRGLLTAEGAELKSARTRVPELAKLLGAPKTTEENRLSRGYLHILDKSWPQRIFIGKTITFGSWYQNNAQEKTPLEWCCIGKRGNAAALMSVKILCFRPWCKAQIHNISQDDFSEHRLRAWKNSDIREWLNTVFLNEAFTPDEQRYMPEMLQTDMAYDYKRHTQTITDRCQDRIFLPWEDDGLSNVLYYDETARISRKMVSNPEATPYALAGSPGAPERSHDGSISWWWLDRSNSWHYGYLYRHAASLGVRPFIWVEL